MAPPAVCHKREEFINYFELFGVYLHGTTRSYPHDCPSMDVSEEAKGVYLCRLLPQALRACAAQETPELLDPHIFLFRCSGKFEDDQQDETQVPSIEPIGKLQLINGVFTAFNVGDIKAESAGNTLRREIGMKLKQYASFIGARRDNQMGEPFVNDPVLVTSKEVTIFLSRCGWIGQFYV